MKLQLTYWARPEASKCLILRTYRRKRATKKRK